MSGLSEGNAHRTIGTFKFKVAAVTSRKMQEHPRSPRSPAANAVLRGQWGSAMGHVYLAKLPCKFAQISWAVHFPCRRTTALHRAALGKHWRQHWNLRSYVRLCRTVGPLDGLWIRLSGSICLALQSSIRTDRCKSRQIAQEIWLQIFWDQCIQPQAKRTYTPKTARLTASEYPSVTNKQSSPEFAHASIAMYLQPMHAKPWFLTFHLQKNMKLRTLCFQA